MKGYARILAIISACLLLYGATYPTEAIHYAGISGNDRAPDAAAELQRVGADVEDHTSANERVLVAEPIWLQGTDRRIAGNSPRWYYAADNNHGRGLGWNRTAWASQLRKQITAGLETGRIGYVIMTPRTHTILARWPTARTAFETNFCRVTPRPAVYRAFDIWTFEYAPGRACTPTTQWDWTATLAERKQT